MAELIPVVAVVDATSEGPTVWWVGLGLRGSAQLSRLCGAAWVIGYAEVDKFELLVGGRIVVATSAGEQALTASEIGVDRRLDVAATLASAKAAQETLRAAFDTEQAARTGSKQMAEPRWPTFPEPLDLDNPPAVKALPAAPKALRIARWLADLASRWEDVAAERLARPLLRGLGGNQPLVLPLVLAES